MSGEGQEGGISGGTAVGWNAPPWGCYEYALSAWADVAQWGLFREHYCQFHKRNSLDTLSIAQ